MGETCSTHGRDEKFVQNFSSITGRDHSKDLGIDGDNIKMDLKESV
jgi:hypothetical protein